MKRFSLISIGLIFCLIVIVQIVAAPAPITVVSPNGGENLVLGTTTTIKWTYDSSSVPGAMVRIDLLRGETAIGGFNTGIGSGGSGSYSLTVPSSTPVDNVYKIRVTSTSNPIYTDTSDGSFTVCNAITAFTALQEIVATLQSSVAELWGNATEQQSTIQSETMAREAADNDLHEKINDIQPVSSVHFGEWNDGPFKCSVDGYNRSIYLAETDGFICAFGQPVAGYTGQDPDALILRVGSTHNQYTWSCTLPVRKGDYWEIVTAPNVFDPPGTLCPTIYWIPLIP